MSDGMSDSRCTYEAAMVEEAGGVKFKYPIEGDFEHFRHGCAFEAPFLDLSVTCGTKEDCLAALPAALSRKLAELRDSVTRASRLIKSIEEVLPEEYDGYHVLKQRIFDMNLDVKKIKSVISKVTAGVKNSGGEVTPKTKIYLELLNKELKAAEDYHTNKG